MVATLLHRLGRALLLALVLYVPVNSFANPPDILLAHVYRDGVDVSAYLVSEKLDGVRAIWDGNSLVTRQGNPIYAPAWFTKDFPKQAMDGELWMAHRQFDLVSGTVRQVEPNAEVWQKITYQVFELPQANGVFISRAQQIEALVKQTHSPYLRAVKQFKLKNAEALKAKLNQVVAVGGEGLMLHRADAAYVTGRSDVLLKLKPQLDAEATVIEYIAGKGKYQGKMGALLVETPEGIRFKLGTGFSDAQRAHPPAIGSLVTYTYRDMTKTGKPKFASFLRERKE